MRSATEKVMRAIVPKNLNTEAAKREEIKRQYREHMKRQFAYQGRKLDLVFADKN